ncbi:SDR family oxidoreductase [Streptomyces sp. NPDC127108]|uniref:SDR family oxidoreductase n=1 Tax=Streptomyces sp. NPDC127108 TaxID=3345361 RepID=UPI0036268B43
MEGMDGRVVVVTGASSGIGEAAALLLAERGARLVLGARRSERLLDLVERIDKAGGTATHARTDVTRRDDLHALVTLARERFGRIDVLVSNADAGTISPLDDLRVDEWDQMVDVNIKDVLHGIGAALPAFRAQGTGHFITVSPGMIGTDFAEASTNSRVRAEITKMRDRIAIPPEAIARAIAFAIEQPATVDVNEIVVRPTAQH